MFTVKTAEGCAAQSRVAAMATVAGLAAVSYPALNVWPEPTTINLPANPLGPHVLPPTVAVTIDPACGEAVADRLNDLLHSTNATVYKAPTRTYAEAAYTDADSFCLAAQRCSDDAMPKNCGIM